MSAEVRRITIPEKRTYTHREFVGRRKELGEVARRVAQGKCGENIDLPVLNFWGIEGSGKSWLLRHIARLYRGPGLLRKGERKRTFTALVDLASFDPFEWTPRNLATLLKSAIEDVIEQRADTIQEPSKLLACVEAADVGKETAEELAQAFVDWITGSTDRFVPLVLLDTIERATPEALIQIELRLIEPLVHTDAVIMVTAGRREVGSWRRFAVRSRQGRPIELTSLSSRDTANQIQKQGFDLSGELVYGYSFGLAYASQVIASAMSELSGGRKVDEKYLRKNEHSLEPWLEALDHHFLQAVPAELRGVLRALCVLRAIREGALPYLLSAKDGERRALLDRLQATPLVGWDSDQGAYLMHPSLRRLLSLHLRLQEPSVFSKRHSQAAEYYVQAIKANPYDCGPLLIEALYHYGYANQPSKITKLLSAVLQTDYFTIGGVEFLLEQLEEDEEMHSALAASLVNRVIRSAQKLRQDVRHTRLSVN